MRGGPATGIPTATGGLSGRRELEDSELLVPGRRSSPWTGCSIKPNAARLFSGRLPLPGLGHYQARAWVIMANHVHLLVTPLVSGSKLLGSLTAATGRRANILLKRTGHPLLAGGEL